MHWFYCLECKNCSLECDCPDDGAERHLQDLRNWMGDIAVHSLVEAQEEGDSQMVMHLLLRWFDRWPRHMCTYLHGRYSQGYG